MKTNGQFYQRQLNPKTKMVSCDLKETTSCDLKEKGGLMS